MFACMHVCMYVCMYAFMHPSMFTCMYLGGHSHFVFAHDSSKDFFLDCFIKIYYCFNISVNKEWTLCVTHGNTKEYCQTNSDLLVRQARM